jgi:deoxyhypusine synthase
MNTTSAQNGQACVHETQKCGKSESSIAKTKENGFENCMNGNQATNDKIAQLVSEAFDSVMEIDARPIDPTPVMGYNFEGGLNYDKLFTSFRTTGIQATNFALAVEEINKMIECKLKPIDLSSADVTQAAKQFKSLGLSASDNEYYSLLQRSNCTIFLGYTSNMISSGVRETILFLAKNRMIDCIVSTAGGIEEDFMKCMAPAFMGKFEYDGLELRKRGLNRIGNMVVPNDNYRLFEDWLLRILDQMLVEQREKSVNWTPSKLISRLGREINDERSVYYWAYKNNIPVFCPAITDGAIGDTIFYHAYKSPGLRIDLVEDIQRMDLLSLFAVNTGAIILGGGTSKHHILNANCMRNGTNYSVFVNTGQEFDSSDTGAKPEEALSWAKIRPNATPVKVYGEAALIFPLLVSQTFAKNFPTNN